jgi:putative CocE/NonD family hydrolase
VRSVQPCLVTISALCLCPLSVREVEAQPTPYDAVLYQESVRVPMRDGVRLATDIYRPTRNGEVVDDPLPALLTRTPYGKGGSGLTARARYFASHGYVVVVQDMRGRYESEGVFEKYHDYDAYDGYDTIEWIATLPYTAGKVGMWGTSYGAHAQADAAKMDPPSLGALLLNFGGLSNGWTHKVRNHGALELAQQLGWAWGELPADADDPVIRKMFESEDVADWFEAIPFREGLNPLSVRPNFEAYFLRMQNHGDYDEVWKGLGVNWEEHYVETADVPMLHVGGWYDPYTETTTRNFTELSRLKESPMHMIVGPWTHGANGRSFAGDVEFGPAAAIPDFGDEFHLRWFDHHLKGVSNAAGDLPVVRVFVMGTGDGHRDANGRLYHGGYWRDGASWPLPEVEPTPFYLHADGSLSPQPAPEASAATTYTYDPDRPVPTIGGSFSGVLKRGPYDQREREFKSLRGGSESGFYGSRPPYLPLSSRPDVLVFQTPPLDAEVEIAGPISVHLHVSSTAVDTDFTAKLIDVYPPSVDYPMGFAMNLTDGIVRARYHASRERPAPMTPGEVYELVIEPFPTANVFKRGHRIRVDISSSNFPRFDVNPNTGDALGRHRRTIPADNTVHHDRGRPSHVILPIIPSGR